MDTSARRGRASGCSVTTARLRLCSGSRGRGSRGGGRGRERVREFQGGGVARVEKARTSREAGGGKARACAPRAHALLPTGRRWKTTGRWRWAGLALPGWAATVVGRLAHQVGSPSFSFNFVFYYSVVFRALLKILRHFQKSPNCSCSLYGINPTWNISV